MDEDHKNTQNIKKQKTEYINISKTGLLFHDVVIY